MSNAIRRLFCPTPEEEAEDLAKFIALHKELAKDRGCETCRNTRHMVDYPGFVTGEENECTAGLECDTVFFTVRNCPRWADSLQEEIDEWINR